MLILSRAVLISAVIAAASAQGANADKSSKVAPGYHTEHVVIDGVRRKFKVYVPKHLVSDAAAPLVIVLHGALCSPAIVRWISKMSSESEKRGFIVIYPCGLSPGLWNAGGLCSVYRWKHSKDVEFISSVIDYSVEHLQSDPNKTFVAGVSNGGMMAYRLAAEIPQKIAAIAPVNGVMVCDKPDNSTTPVSVIAFHGQKDRIVKFDGSGGQWLFWKVRTPPVQSTIDYWVKRDHCDTPPKIDSGVGYSQEIFRGGSDGTEVCLYKITDAGHTWPGGRMSRILNPLHSHEFSVTTAMCDFFAKHPKQTKDFQPREEQPE